MASVHPSSFVGTEVELDDVEVGPNCVIEGKVRVASGTQIGPGCVFRGPAAIGTDNIFHGACFVDASQDKKREGTGGRIEIGDDNVMREYTTLHRSTLATGRTKIGNGNLLMAYSHVAHDCTVGDGTVLVNAVQLGGEVEVHDHSIVGGGALIHQRCRIGTLAIVGAGTMVRQDVPPYANHAATPTKVAVGINKVGLERAGMKDKIDVVAKAYSVLYRKGLGLDEATTKIGEMAATEDVLAPLEDFLKSVGTAGLVRPRLSG